MKFKYLHILLFLSLLTCQNKNIDITNGNTVLENNSLENNSNEFSILHNGNIVNVNKNHTENNEYLFHEIETKKQDISFRAKRVSTKYYLKNKKVKESELENALEDLKGEQLIYFEFEEFQKQDLVHKYMNDDLDFYMSYLSFHIYNDFTIVKNNGEKIKANYSIYEKEYQIAPYERLLVSFSNINEEEGFELIYNDILFKKGEVNFYFPHFKIVETHIKTPL